MPSNTADDWQPADRPTADQQLDALRKGLGRAMLWASSGHLDDDPLMAACLTDLTHDQQVEMPRGDWLWGVVVAAGAADRLRAPILDALARLPDARSAGQLCELAYHYAASGDGAFRDRLRAIVALKPLADDRGLGESKWIRLAGDNGFRLAASVRGRQLLDRDWDWDDGVLVSAAAEHLGAGRVGDLLDQANDADLSRFRDAWRRDQIDQARRDRPANSRSIRGRDAAAVIRAAAAGGHFGWGFWGRDADEVQLALVAAQLWRINEPQALTYLLRIFADRALPAFDPRLIALCAHANPGVSRAAWFALAANRHPLVREFALAELARRDFDHPVVCLFARNFRPGDDDLILGAIEPDIEANLLHWLLMDVLKVLWANPDADASRPGSAVYALTPCQNCRADALKVLLDRDAAPAWMRAEARHDSYEQCRALVEPTSAG